MHVVQVLNTFFPAKRFFLKLRACATHVKVSNTCVMTKRICLTMPIETAYFMSLACISDQCLVHSVSEMHVHEAQNMFALNECARRPKCVRPHVKCECTRTQTHAICVLNTLYIACDGYRACTVEVKSVSVCSILFILFRSVSNLVNDS